MQFEFNKIFILLARSHDKYESTCCGFLLLYIQKNMSLAAFLVYFGICSSYPTQLQLDLQTDNKVSDL